MSGEEATKHKSRPYGIPVVIALVVFFFLLILYINPGLQEHTPWSFETWMKVGYLINIAMLCWLAIWKITLSTEVREEVNVPAAKPGEVLEPEEEMEAPPKKRAVAPARPTERVPGGVTAAKREAAPSDLKGMPHVVEWPPKEPGSVYSDTLVRVDLELVLNVRVLLGKVCTNCDELDNCRRRVRDKLPDDVFEYNFECKDGLKRELSRARKKRKAADQKAKEAKRIVAEKAEAKTTTARGKSKGAPSKAKTTTKKGRTTTASSKKKGSKKASAKKT